METPSATVDVSEMMSSEVHFHASVLSRDVAEIVPSMDLNGSHAKSCSAGNQLNLTFSGNVCHVFEKNGNNLEL